MTLVVEDYTLNHITFCSIFSDNLNFCILTHCLKEEEESRKMLRVGKQCTFKENFPKKRRNENKDC